MKTFCIFTVVFLAVGICSITAQDIIVFKDGTMLESKVLEISPTEIKYKRFDHMDGPIIVIPTNNVLSIRYENGRVDTIHAAKTTAIDTNKFIFGINANPGGFLSSPGSGSGVNIELGKGNFNTEINLMIPRSGGFGGLVTFNGFWPSQIGGFYLGGGIGLGLYNDDKYDKYDYREGGDRIRTHSSLPVGLNIGYKFVTKSGLYFRTGAFIGFDFWGYPLYLKPDLAIGWTMK